MDYTARHFNKMFEDGARSKVYDLLQQIDQRTSWKKTCDVEYNKH